MTRQKFDVIVVGNGAIGSSLAVELADRGLTVALIGPANRQYAASTASGAMLGCFGEVTADLVSDQPGQAKFALDLKARGLWSDWVGKISEHSPLDGTDLFTASGTTVILNTVGTREIDSENFSAIQRALHENNEPFESVDVDDIGWIDADPNSRPVAAIHIPGEHAVDSGRLLVRLEGAAVARGCTLIPEHAVSLREDRGRIRAVVLDNGDVLEADQIVLAAGVGTQTLIDSVPGLGDTIPRLVAGYGVSVVMTTHDGTQPQSVIRTPNRAFACGLHVVPRGMGQVYVGATNIINPTVMTEPVLRDLEFLLQCAHRQIRRNLWSSSVRRISVGNRPVSLDGFPLLGETPVQGLWMATGTYRDGLFLSPLIAKEFGDRLTGGTGEADLSLFTPERAPVQRAGGRARVIDTTVQHMLATGYEHHWNIPTDWQEYLEADLYPIYQNWANQIDGDYTPPPELVASSRLHPQMVQWLRDYYAATREKFGTPDRSPAPTRAELTRAATRQLRTAKVWTPDADAQTLAEHAFGDTKGDAIPEATERQRFLDLVARRANREPLEYLVGHVRVLGLDLAVRPDVFIPRVHSEAMVDTAIAQLTTEKPAVVDFCTGTGAIALAIATRLPHASVIGADVSESAIACAKENASRLGAALTNQVEFLHADINNADFAEHLTGQVDLVTANPPYVPNDLHMPSEWAVYQPDGALYSGADGLDLTRVVARTAHRLLRPGGVLALEHYDAALDQIITILDDAGFVNIASHRDHDNLPRFTIAVKAS
ncbi:peptide chain release factor N(5)-glutamine methyltransferase [Micromonospora echinospora]